MIWNFLNRSFSYSFFSLNICFLFSFDWKLNLDELSQHLNRFCMNSEYSDVTFIVDDEKLFAHKNILAMRSAYFRGLLYGGLAEATQREIKLNDVPLEAFKATLIYIYTGCMALCEMKDELILDVLGLAELYSFEALNFIVSDRKSVWKKLLQNCRFGQTLQSRDA